MLQGAFLKVALLLFLAVQNAGQTVLIKYAQSVGGSPDALVLMLLAEGVKFVVSIILHVAFEVEPPRAKQLQNLEMLSARTVKLLPISCAFALQNQLVFVAVNSLEPPVYQALSQLKIIAAGVFSWLLLGKQLGLVQWVSLVLLACGAALVQIESMLCPTAEPTRQPDDLVRGLLAVIVSSSTSGLAGCYTELSLKTLRMPTWLQSAQIALYSVLVLGGLVVGYRGMPTPEYLDGFVAATWAVVLAVSLGGLLVVAVLRLADNILKSISIVMSLLLSAVLSSVLFGSHVGSIFCIAAIVICCSVVLYQQEATPRAPEGKKEEAEAADEQDLESDERRATITKVAE